MQVTVAGLGLGGDSGPPDSESRVWRVTRRRRRAQALNLPGPGMIGRPVPAARNRAVAAH
jgi:hypothetical protein